MLFSSAIPKLKHLYDIHQSIISFSYRFSTLISISDSDSVLYQTGPADTVGCKRLKPLPAKGSRRPEGTDYNAPIHHVALPLPYRPYPQYTEKKNLGRIGARHEATLNVSIKRLHTDALILSKRRLMRYIKGLGKGVSVPRPISPQPLKPHIQHQTTPNHIFPILSILPIANLTLSSFSYPFMPHFPRRKFTSTVHVYPAFYPRSPTYPSHFLTPFLSPLPLAPVH